MTYVLALSNTHQVMRSRIFKAVMDVNGERHTYSLVTEGIRVRILKCIRTRISTFPRPQI